MMPMPNNPMQMLMQMMQGGGNPMSFFDQMGRNNPQVQQFNQMIRGKKFKSTSQYGRKHCQRTRD